VLSGLKAAVSCVFVMSKRSVLWLMVFVLASSMVIVSQAACEKCDGGTKCGEKNAKGLYCYCHNICLSNEDLACDYSCDLSAEERPDGGKSGVVSSTVPAGTATQATDSANTATAGGQSVGNAPCCGKKFSPDQAENPANASSGLCANALKDPGETDTDCGGTCNPCGNGLSCRLDGDCMSLACKDGVCVLTFCSDNVLDNDETDVDCGGSCNPCLDGGRCLKDSDCASASCVGSVCGKSNAAIDDGKQAETTSVPATTVTKDRTCSKNSDCASGVCKDNACAQPSCSDGIKNGGETGVDCGGSCKGCEGQLTTIFPGDITPFLPMIIAAVVVLALLSFVLKKKQAASERKDLKEALDEVNKDLSLQEQLKAPGTEPKKDAPK